MIGFTLILAGVVVALIGMVLLMAIISEKLHDINKTLEKIRGA